MNRFYEKALAVLALLSCLALTGCSLKEKLSGSASGTKTISRPAVESAETQFAHPAAGDTVAVFDTSAGVFKAVLFPTLAPQACDNFLGLVQAGYYNGLTVSRVENEFLVEAGQGADGRGATIWNGSPPRPCPHTPARTRCRCSRGKGRRPPSGRPPRLRRGNRRRSSGPPAPA